MTDYRFIIPKTQWLTANDRLHHHARRRRTAWLRETAAQQAWGTPPAPIPAHVTYTIQYATNRRADPANAYPTVKALLDGLVDAGVLADDDHEHVIGPDPRRGPKHGTPGEYHITITITEGVVHGPHPHDKT